MGILSSRVVRHSLFHEHLACMHSLSRFEVVYTSNLMYMAYTSYKITNTIIIIGYLVRMIIIIAYTPILKKFIDGSWAMGVEMQTAIQRVEPCDLYVFQSSHSHPSLVIPAQPCRLRRTTQSRIDFFDEFRSLRLFLPSTWSDWATYQPTYSCSVDVLIVHVTAAP